VFTFAKFFTKNGCDSEILTTLTALSAEGERGWVGGEEIEKENERGGERSSLQKSVCKFIQKYFYMMDTGK
jgi:hypothetical protein